jgi:hypothetical protein
VVAAADGMPARLLVAEKVRLPQKVAPVHWAEADFLDMDNGTDG